METEKFYCQICGMYSHSEDDVYYHIKEEHDMFEIISFCISRTKLDLDDSDIDLM